MIQYSRSASGLQDLSPSEQQLIDRALWCVKRGFAPPAEIYRVEHRRHIDWVETSIVRLWYLFRRGPLTRRTTPVHIYDRRGLLG